MANYNLDTESFIKGQDLFQTPYIDTSSYEERQKQFADLFNQQEQQRELQNQIEYQQLGQQAEQAKRNIQSEQTSRGIGFSGLAQEQLGSLEGQTDVALTEKQQKDLTEKAFIKKEQMQALRQQFAARMAADLQRKFAQNVDRFNANLRKFQKTAEWKFMNDVNSRQKFEQDQYDKAVANISRRMNTVNAFNRIHQSIASVLGVIHPVAGMIAQGGATTGKVISNAYANKENQALIDAYRQGRF